ncbi:MAG: undecaprenyl-phosphate glucose phosphotransferase [Porticoccaceae bacterium]
MVAVLQLILTFPGRPRLNLTQVEIVRSIVLKWLVTAGALLGLGYLTGYLASFNIDAVFEWLLLTPLAVYIATQLFRLTAGVYLKRRAHNQPAVIVGMNAQGIALAKQIQGDAYVGQTLRGFFEERDRDTGRFPTHTQMNIIGRFSELANYVKTEHVNHIYLSLPMASQPRILDLVDQLRDTTASIYFVPDMFVTDLIQSRMDKVGDTSIVAICETPFTGVNSIVKRSSDIVLSILLLALLTPVLFLIALCVKCTSRGPVIFKQRRYGLEGEEILVYKFRTMSVLEDGETIVQATQNDPRITRLGAFLRRTSLDELPQFVNVLQGRMSVVGPRPHAVAHNELYRKLIKGYMIRHKVKPGITGLAQVNGYRGETDSLEKMQRRIDYDLDYLRHWSLSNDLYIIAKTVLVIFKDRHAY